MTPNSRRFVPAIVNPHLILLFVVCILCWQSSLAPRLAAQEEKASPCRDRLRLDSECARELALRRKQFIDDAIAAFAAIADDDSIPTFRLQAPNDSIFYLTPENIGRVPYLGPDPFADEFHRKMSDVPPMFKLNHLVGGIAAAIQKWKKEHRNSWPIPDDTEIDVLKVLWSKQTATGSEIYALVDTSIQLSSEDLQAKLKQMVGRGFVDRKLISPFQEFKLSGIFAIELNSKNRKNRVFVYWPAVSREKLVAYLDSQRYGRSTIAADERKLAALDRRLERSLYRLAQRRMF